MKNQNINMKNLAKQTSLKAVALSALLLMAILPMRAQWYIGGGFHFTENNAISANHFSPDFGYSFNPRWTIGTAFSYQNKKYTYLNASSVSFSKTEEHWFLSPYIRYSFYQNDRLSLFVDATMDLKLNGFDAYSYGLRPGLSYGLSDHFTAVATFGFVGNKAHLWTADFQPSSLNFSLFYVFSKKK